MESESETFAVVVTGEGPIDVAGAGRVLAEPLESTVADLVPVLASRSGILAEGLTEFQARRCVALLADERIVAKAVAAADVIETPEACVLRSANLEEAGLRFVSQGEEEERIEGLVTWPEVVWLNCVSVQEISTEKFEDWEVKSRTETRGVRRVEKERLKTTRPLQIDVVAREPWTWLQIQEQKFQFATTGLTVQPNRRLNMFAIATGLGLRSPGAVLGPGMAWFVDRTPPREQQFGTRAAHVNHLRWELTRVWMED